MLFIPAQCVCTIIMNVKSLGSVDVTLKCLFGNSDYLQKDNCTSIHDGAGLCLEMFRPGLLGSLGGRRYKQSAPL